MTKIGIFNARFYPALGGIENYIYFVSQELLTLGHQVVVVSEQHSRFLPPKQSIDSIQVLRHPRYITSIPRIVRPFVAMAIGPRLSTRHLERFLRVNVYDIDLIWARHPVYAYAACRAFPGKPMIYIQASVFPLHLSYANKS